MKMFWLLPVLGGGMHVHEVLGVCQCSLSRAEPTLEFNQSAFGWDWGMRVGKRVATSLLLTWL